MARRVLALSTSPRRNGNSQRLAEAFVEGAREAGHEAELLNVNDYLRHFLRDCRECRGPDGFCRLDDEYKTLFYDHFLRAQAVAFATPIYWYGVSAQLKAFFDRSFCFYAASCPDSPCVIEAMCRKRLALLLVSEESYVGATLGILGEIQEYTRYTHSELVGVVQGIGNRRGDIERDPADPLGRARDLGRRIFDLRYTDYRLDTVRPASTWP